MKKLLWLLILALASFTSCKKGTITDCFYSTGKMSNEDRSIDNFNSILLKDNVNLILIKSENNSIKVEAGANLINQIKTDVNEKGVLVIKNDNKCNWIRSYESPITVYLNYIDIDSIEYRSIGDINTLDTLFTDTLWLSINEGAGKINLELNVLRLYCALHYGTADIVLSGKSGLSFVYSASFGLIDMINMETSSMYVNNRSSNDIYLTATTHLGATIENIGNIYYAGNPLTVDLNRIGSGELIKITE
ncbi:MAG TPA: head GIN domain-containing protein [Bacteroidales bacterium]|nr:head GIN domain-containing protein [Bacteroidales bacterium]